ncbi:MAG TPA: hypothetical protein PLV42_11505 [bacterium]|nr:hypothetical protein [bacterium]
MFTGDRLLKLVSGALLGLFILFALIVTVRELMRSADPLNRIVAEQCLTLAAAGTDAPPGANFLPQVPATVDELLKNGATCVFFDGTTRDASPLSRSLFARTPLTGWDYLYLGPRGVLMIRDERTFAAEAEAIRRCLRDGNCDAGQIGTQELSLTVSLSTAKGERPVTFSFYDESLADILKKTPGLITEMSGAKKVDPKTLILETAFHRHYALIVQPDEPSIGALARADRDGLLIASRGAKIRLLPWEYTKNPLRRLSTKAAQYGLDKDEYKKDIASVKIFATARYREENGVMTERIIDGGPAADGR